MSELLEKYYPILAFKKAFWGMDWEMNLQPLRKSAKVKNLFVHWEKATAAGDAFFDFDLGEAVTLE